ncbi:jg22555, partial [Pararge aegeria aegeria]
FAHCYCLVFKYFPAKRWVSKSSLSW